MEVEETKRFAILRKRLDKFNYTQPLSKDSVVLVERILNDLIKASEGYQNQKREFEELKVSSGKSFDMIDPMKREIKKLEAENNDLHFQIIKIKEEMDGKDIKWKTAYSRMEEQKNDLKYLLEQKDTKLEQLTKDNLGYKTKVQDLISKLYLPSEGLVLKGIPKELEQEILSKEHNQRRKNKQRQQSNLEASGLNKKDVDGIVSELSIKNKEDYEVLVDSLKNADLKVLSLSVKFQEFFLIRRT